MKLKIFLVIFIFFLFALSAKAITILQAPSGGTGLGLVNVTGGDVGNCLKVNTVTANNFTYILGTCGSGGGGGSGGGWATSSPNIISTNWLSSTNALVGINSSTPNGVLVVQGISATTTPTLIVASSTGASLFQVNSNGNVGIGTTSPSQLLTVGNNNQFLVNSSGDFTQNGPATNQSLQFHKYAYGWEFQGNGGTDTNANSFQFAVPTWISITKSLTDTNYNDHSIQPGLVVRDSFDEMGLEMKMNIGASNYGEIDAGYRDGIGSTTPIGLRLITTNGSAAEFTNIEAQPPGVSAGNLILQKTSGNVGIGLTNPLRQLDIRNSSGNNQSLTLENNDFVNGVSGTSLQFASGATTGNTYYQIQTLSSGETGSGILALNPAGGNVGIGLTSPNYTLEVAGTASTTNLNVATNTTLKNVTNTFLATDPTGLIISTTSPLSVALAATTYPTFTYASSSYASSKFDKSFQIASTTLDTTNLQFSNATTTWNLWNPSYAVTLTKLYCKTDTGTLLLNFGGNLLSCTSTGASSTPSTNYAVEANVNASLGSAASTPNNVRVTATFKSQ